MMASKRAYIVMVCIAGKLGEEAMAKIKREFPYAEGEVRVCDLRDRESINKLAAGILSDFKRLDILNNNAGIGMNAVRVVNGVEETLAVNVIAPYLLTGLLLPLLLNTKDSRILFASSIRATSATAIPIVNVNEIADSTTSFRMKRYPITKAINEMFARKLAKELERTRHSSVKAVVAHPGLASTPFTDNIDVGPLRLFYKWILFPCLGHSAEVGSASFLFAATSPHVQSGEFYGACGYKGMIGWPARSEYSELSRNETFAKEVWAWCEKVTGFTYRF
jgi:NAD(P)-dependent dehydrogenase (short-subunit alcohol dehydrogenase family)